MTTNKEQQIKNSFIYLIPVIISNLLPFLTFPIFTRIFSTHDYGVLALAQVYATFATGLANFGMLTGFERNFFQYQENKTRGQLFYSVLIFVATALVVLGSITFLLKAQLAQWIIGSAAYADFLFLAFCANATLILKPYFLTYYKNQENAKTSVRYSVVDSILSAFIAIVLIVYFRIGISGIFWGQLISGSITLVFMSKNFLRVLPFSMNRDVLMDCLKISFPLTPMIFLKIINTQFDKYMI